MDDQRMGSDNTLIFLNEKSGLDLLINEKLKRSCTAYENIMTMNKQCNTQKINKIQ